MSIQSDIQRLVPGALIEMFEIDLNTIGIDEKYYFHNGVNELGEDLVWQGQVYTRFPIEVDGFEWSGSGSQPRPTLRVANITGLIGALLKANDDLVKTKVIRRRTFARYLDPENFIGGVNPTADPLVHFDDEAWYIDRKASEGVIVEWELAPAFDLTGVMLPGCQVIQNVCMWRYRDADCGYAGDPVADINDQPTSDPLQDVCGKRLGSCRLRFGNEELPFGGFPAAALLV